MASTTLGVLETPTAAVSRKHLLRAPGGFEGAASRTKLMDQSLSHRVVAPSGGVGAELGNEAARALVPVDDESPCLHVQENVSQQISVCALYRARRDIGW
jgi:hypothetical protein